jgi:hypothetical protein
MGGVAKPVLQAVGLEKKPKAPEMPMAESAEDAVEKASAMDEQQGARMRGARRRGRQLLSDARLNPESGQTLGGGNSLGQ